jgi:hypothetical protein
VLRGTAVSNGGAGLAGGVGDAVWLDRELAIALVGAWPRAFLITGSDVESRRAIPLDRRTGRELRRGWEIGDGRSD